ncbi:FecR family protein [Algoriphagus chordae]|uniref:FecR family protein n=1 Tax=Algoriphagus chordae TaxID=237019 RepID=A0A2W7QJ07_9BACT|nr:FecR family protein [Algoriphagus chordae]PZX48313.1 FecR family protein [Algoriphagus chordae]
MDKDKQFKEFFEGRMSEPEATVFCAWLNTEEGAAYLDSRIDRAWNSKRGNSNYPAWDSQTILQKINAEKAGYEQQKPDNKQAKEVNFSPRNHFPSWLSVAAIVALVVLIPFVFFKANNSGSTQQREPQPKIITRSNPSGVKSKFHLPDGSLVSLNSESSIVYQEDFAVNRNIELIGEAYITVAKDSLHPFVIKSSGLNTEALGTIFNIKAYANENSVEVLLVEGKVKVDNIDSNEALILVPGEKAVLSNERGDFEKKNGDITRETQWTQGVLEFKNQGFQEIFKYLERWYGVKIEVTGNMTKAKGLGKFQEGESLDNVLEVLSYSNYFNYKINKDTVFVDFNKD